MSFQKFKSKSFYVGVRNHSATSNIVGDVTFKDRKIVSDQCSKCNRKKSMTVTDFRNAAYCL